MSPTSTATPRPVQTAAPARAAGSVAGRTLLRACYRSACPRRVVLTCRSRKLHSAPVTTGASLAGPVDGADHRHPICDPIHRRDPRWRAGRGFASPKSCWRTHAAAAAVRDTRTLKGSGSGRCSPDPRTWHDASLPLTLLAPCSLHPYRSGWRCRWSIHRHPGARRHTTTYGLARRPAVDERPSVRAGRVLLFGHRNAGHACTVLAKVLLVRAPAYRELRFQPVAVSAASAVYGGAKQRHAAMSVFTSVDSSARVR